MEEYRCGFEMIRVNEGRFQILDIFASKAFDNNINPPIRKLAPRYYIPHAAA